MKSKNLFRDEEFRTPEMCNPPQDGIDCVAVAINKNGVAVRSTHDPKKTTTVFTNTEWRNFITSVKQGNFSV
ncbi:MAG: hypothetical protein A3C08_00485 [Candidatus Taylorbacteria bacterium RIFCSPHIGHO2_02_FULL_47_18]|uniref:DUF397 domain-containing protein n=1 Tax=Candidatus Taylorbacteria bacterium RIFCSPLOWO2_01_FULL_48_100 TaxID=1802322 RepID=A0A1G2NFA3_9BACT|nr:MAG: hypothetical protein A2670_00200 [Candidatus Taylorbacteria bacterium RIFCSPHIGHO2_01_FULL_48_38]OHA27836.1 MAG: hypothetical protein A3C08_00485 [Candidatus Taylorbacteria bacterium RIFCSPHIGHO2_02_FULL_47_18]OHA34770.1 MAG: hypothetical protein A2938_03635 [Candidatus Taylorbacteria bacterium RIFCSPLOWO2_01_FULL_48_100]OHA40923.1 MAG: hypothetical protein A3J31_03930 [Candidatus Taylorbacteria bacterium RIFCSPLOWO2_02_FULL_48_16]OHA45067.1 MAG: hypothetical protein A3H13_02645 [Candid